MWKLTDYITGHAKRPTLKKLHALTYIRVNSTSGTTSLVDKVLSSSVELEIESLFSYSSEMSKVS